MIEIRSSIVQSNEPMKLIGTPIVFDKEAVINTKMGSYKEIIKSGALDGADMTDVSLLYNHDTSKLPLARTPNTMGFSVDSGGLHVNAILPDTEEARATYSAVSRGDLRGMSFTFKVAPGGSSFDPKTNTRTITKIAKVFEVSLTPFPAYAETSVEARSQMVEAQGRVIEKNNLKIKVNQILRGDF